MEIDNTVESISTEDLLDQFPDNEPFDLFSESGEEVKEVQEEPAQVEEETPSQEGGEVETSEEVTTEDTPTEENIPFHKHPRFAAAIKENKEMRERLEKLEAMSQQPKAEEVVETVPVHLQHVFGDDVQAYKATMAEIQSTSKKEAAEAIAALKAEQTEKAQAEQRQLEEQKQREEEFIVWANDELTNLGKEIGEDLSDDKNNTRNKILKIVETEEIRLANGYPNFKAAYKILKAQESSIDKKSLARKTAPSTSTGTGSPVITPGRLARSSPLDFL